MTATDSTLRARIHALLHFTEPTDAGRRWRALHLAVLAIGLFAVILLSVNGLPSNLRHALRYAVGIVAILFSVEYLLRLWTAPEAKRYGDSSAAGARFHWALSLPGLVGFLATVPVFMWLGGYRIAGSDAASIFCVLWVLKLGLHAPALGTLLRVVSNERAPIASVLVLFLIVLVVAATGAHLLESEHQPKAFGSLPDALWWAVVTLTTTGYGDVVPVTVGGRMLGALLMISGITVLAIMTGVLATGFAQEERRREYLRVWEHVARVPIFTALGVVTLSEIVGKLRTRYYPSRIAIVRRGDPGDSMFFISSGEVEVRLPAGGAVRLGEGAFFGEMALLERQPRTATVATLRPTTLLVLYASDFYEIASHIPALAEAVENEAKRRRDENTDRKSSETKR